MDQGPVKPIKSKAQTVLLESIFSRNPISPLCESKASRSTYEELGATIERILFQDLHMAVPRHIRAVPFTRIFATSEMIIYALNRSDDIMLEAMYPSYPGNFLAFHSLNVAFLACMVGVEMGFTYQQLSELVVAAILHDIGMTKLSDGAFAHDRALSKEERRIIETHPFLAYRFFENLEREVPWLLRVVLEEHKREQGQGYPREVTGELHPYSKIIGLCDSLEALCHTRHFRKAFHPADAIQQILKIKGALYAEDVLRCLINSISIYPVSSLVRLSNNALAQVVAPVHGSPLKPIVKTIKHETGPSIEGGVQLDLSRKHELYIASIVYDDNYEKPADELAHEHCVIQGSVQLISR